MTRSPEGIVRAEGTDPAVRAVADRAVELVVDGARLGLGSGRAVASFIQRLGLRIGPAFRVGAVPSSRASAKLAHRAGLTVLPLEAGPPLDLMIDGADEVASNLDLIKGWGGAMVRERIVMAAARRQVIIVGTEKLVGRLGERGRLPVEVIPFALDVVRQEVERLGLNPAVRMDESGLAPWRSENGNVTLDCALAEPLRHPAASRALERALLSIAGVVDTGLFLGTADEVLVGHADGRVDTLCRVRE